MLTFLLWYLAITLLGWLAFPLSYNSFRRLPDRGYAFAKPLGLLFFGFLFWFLGSLGLLYNDLGGLLFCLFLLGALAVLPRSHVSRPGQLPHGPPASAR